MDKNDIKPSFVKTTPKKSIKQRPVKPAENDAEEAEIDANTPGVNKSFMDSIRENKVMIAALAIIIIILMVIILYLNFKPSKVAKVPPPIVPPPQQQQQQQTQSNMQTQPSQPPPPQPQPQQNVQPQSPKSILKAQTQPQSAAKVMSHEQIINTVDDDELNKYINISDEPTVAITKPIINEPKINENESSEDVDGITDAVNDIDDI